MSGSFRPGTTAAVSRSGPLWSPDRGTTCWPIREFTYVDDIVRGNLLAAERDIAPGSYCNLAGGGEVTLSELIDLVGDLAGAPVRIDEQPRQPGDAFRNGGSIKRAGELLDWAPEVSLRDGVRAQL